MPGGGGASPASTTRVPKLTTCCPTAAVGARRATRASTTPSSGPSTARRRLRAWCRRDMTVPIGILSTSAISRYERPSRSLNMIIARRSEEHTSELQSLAYLVCRLLLEKKKNQDSNDDVPH